jgi:hypothetical protein
MNPLSFRLNSLNSRDLKPLMAPRRDVDGCSLSERLTNSSTSSGAIKRCPRPIDIQAFQSVTPDALVVWTGALAAGCRAGEVIARSHRVRRS